MKSNITQVWTSTPIEEPMQHLVTHQSQLPIFHQFPFLILVVNQECVIPLLINETMIDDGWGGKNTMALAHVILLLFILWSHSCNGCNHNQTNQKTHWVIAKIL
jgi:hypothetical protein